MIFRPSAPRALDVADPRADLGRRAGPPLADDRIDEDARRDDRVGVALRLPRFGLLEVAADFAGGRHAGRQIEVALVLNRLRHARLPLLVPVHVRVDDARHHVLAGGVDHRVGRRVPRRARRCRCRRSGRPRRGCRPDRRPAARCRRSPSRCGSGAARGLRVERRRASAARSARPRAEASARVRAMRAAQRATRRTVDVHAAATPQEEARS